MMTGSRSEISVLLDGAARFWPVVVAAMLVGAVAMGAYAFATLPEPGFEGVASVRVMNLTGNASAPTADTVAAAAVGASVREAALGALGAAADGAGAVTSAVEVKDRAVVNIYAVHQDRDAALDFAAAVRSAATSMAMEPLSSWEEADRARLDAYTAELARIDGELVKVDAALAARPDDLTILSAANSLRSQRFSLSVTVSDLRLRLLTYSRSVSEFGEPSVKAISYAGDVAVAGAQGALAGLVVGLAVAVVSSNRRNRRDAV